MQEIKLLGKKIDLNDCEILLDYKPINDDGNKFNQLFQVMGGSWYLENGYLIGSELENKGGILLSREFFKDDVAITIKVSTYLPTTRDLNVVWNAHWDDKTNYLGMSYVSGVNGWYDNLSGIEKNGSSLYATTSLYHYIPGNEITLTSGSINGHCFLVVDNELIIEMIDDQPLHDGYIGISPYCTKLKISEIVVRKLKSQSRYQFYEPEF